jgi:uncharacterized protein (TIGR02271 family)
MLKVASQHCDINTLVNEETGGINILEYTAVSDNDERIGKVLDYVCDENGKLRYVVVETGFWIFGKKVLVPVGRLEIRDDRNDVIIRGLTKDQLKTLPEYKEGQEITTEYEEDVMEGYEPGYVRSGKRRGPEYERMPAFRATQPERIRLIEEHLDIQKRREQVGEVHIGKRVETHTETVEVPLSEERLVVEHHTPDRETPASEARMGESDEEITIPLYKEEVDVSKRQVVSDEVTVRKEADTHTERVSEEVRRERLDVEESRGGRTMGEERMGREQEERVEGEEKGLERGVQRRGKRHGASPPWETS